MGFARQGWGGEGESNGPPRPLKLENACFPLQSVLSNMFP